MATGHRVKPKPRPRKKGRPPKPRHVPLSAIDFGDASDDDGEIVQRVPYRTPVQVALAALDTIDRHILVQQILREMVRDQLPAQRAMIAQRVMNACAFVIRESRL